MKKLLAVLMASVMVLGCSTMAFAEEAPAETTEVAATETPELKWEDFEKEIKDKDGWNGEFVEFDEIAVKMYVPEKFEAVELTEEDVENGYIAYYTLGEDYSVGVVYVSADGMTLADYAKILADEFEVKDAQTCIINGVEALTYTNPSDEGIACIAYETAAGCILEFSFAPVNDEGFASVATVMMASIQPAEETEAE